MWGGCFLVFVYLLCIYVETFKDLSNKCVVFYFFFVGLLYFQDLIAKHARRMEENWGKAPPLFKQGNHKG